MSDLLLQIAPFLLGFVDGVFLFATLLIATSGVKELSLQAGMVRLEQGRGSLLCRRSSSSSTPAIVIHSKATPD